MFVQTAERHVKQLRHAHSSLTPSCNRRCEVQRCQWCGSLGGMIADSCLMSWICR